MNLTKALKAHVTAHFGVPADAGDEVFKKAIGDAVANGKLDIAELSKLSASTASEAELKVKSMVDSAVAAAVAPVLDAIKALGTPGNSAAKVEVPAASGAGSGMASKAFAFASGGASVEFDADPEQVKVKSVMDRFDNTRTALTYDRSTNVFLQKSYGGRQVYTASKEFGGRPLDVPTKRDDAITGAWFKRMVRDAYRAKGLAVPQQFQLNEQDRLIIKYAVHNCEFGGDVPSPFGGSVYLDGTKVADNEFWVKTLLDDSMSGGLEAVPIEFDAAVILTPILNGELFPLVDVRNVNRRRIEATAIGNPTVSWGGASGTSVSLFNTDSFISAFDNTIYTIDGAMELGRDFLADSPLDVAGIVQNRYGEVFKKSLDDVIATGDGITQPEGLFTASGVGMVTPAGGAGAAPEVGDYEGLMHGIAKEYQQEAGLPPNSRMVFIGTQTSYQRSRSIPVDSSNDARRIFGQDNQLDYRLMQLRYAINTSLTNAQIGCFCMNRYRMYRRLGFTVEIAMNDAQSIRRNTQTIVVRGRFGGSLEKSAAGMKITNAQA